MGGDGGRPVGIGGHIGGLGGRDLGVGVGDRLSDTEGALIGDRVPRLVGEVKPGPLTEDSTC